METDTGLAGLLAVLAARTTYADLPSEIIERTKLALIDTLACIGSGANTSLGEIAESYAAIASGGAGAGWTAAAGYRAYPKDVRYPSWQTAGFVLGVYAFSQNYGDTSLLSVAHPGSVVIPALLVAAQRRPVTGTEMLLATVVGYEVMELFANELNGGNPKMALQIRGFRPTPTCGPLGVVAAVGRALGLGEQQIEAGLGIAINHAAGLRRTSGDPHSAIRIQSGTAVSLGLAALDLAQAGVKGDPLAFEAPGGFLSAFEAPEQSAQRLRDRLELGPRAPWTLLHMAVKLHCTPQTLATALDCLLDIKATHGIDAGNVERVEIRVPSAHWSISGRPPGRPRSSGEAATNYRYCAAVALLTGDWIWPNTLQEYLDDPAVAVLAERVDVLVDDELTRAFDGGSELWPARASVTVGGVVFSQELSHPRGTRTDEVSRLAVRRKSTVLAASWPTPPDVDAIAELVDNIDRSTDFYADLVAASAVGGAR